jgi:branched-chain amino acid aminotransferase
MDIYYINGQFVDEDKAVVSAKDLVVLRGFGVFDALITYNKRPFLLKDHVERLQNSAKHIGLEIGLSNEEICRITEETIKRNTHHKESKIRIIYTGGISSDGVTPEGNGSLMVMVTPRSKLPDHWYTDGVKIITVDIERILPSAKSTTYLSAIFALSQARQQNAIESVYIDRHDRVLEGTTTNFFMFRDNKLITAGKDILPGITRRVILQLANGHFDVEIRDIDKRDLASAEEIFITASNKEVVPVVQVNDLTVGHGKPGPQTRKIIQLFRDYTTAFSRGES